MLRARARSDAPVTFVSAVAPPAVTIRDLRWDAGAAVAEIVLEAGGRRFVDRVALNDGGVDWCRR